MEIDPLPHAENVNKTPASEYSNALRYVIFLSLLLFQPSSSHKEHYQRKEEPGFAMEECAEGNAVPHDVRYHGNYWVTNQLWICITGDPLN